jgi:hypothetical protein
VAVIGDTLTIHGEKLTVVGFDEWGRPIMWAPGESYLWTDEDCEDVGVPKRKDGSVWIAGYDVVLRFKAAREARRIEASGLWGC